jgi:indolepyruvate ferredoxin oxidoreductase beta subunit
MNDRKHEVVNVVFAGLGGQGVLKASDILSDAAFHAGHDVKKSEVHGMSQRGGSVTSDVRYGSEVFSPMVPVGEAHVLVALDGTQVTPARHVLREGGVLISPELLLKEGQSVDDLDEDRSTPLSRRNLNVGLLGVLSAHLDLAEADWMFGLGRNLPEKVQAQNREVFALGRETGRKMLEG